uniref:Ig-like domain-containing protein n=1 Tax=Paramormyrops kingsleyae TaxID=1676925 RepID=A0A3B3Q2X9_9TELE
MPFLLDCMCNLIACIISLCFAVGVNADKVVQPPLVSSVEGNKAVLTCSHDITDFNSMYWYVQHPNKAPELLIHGYNTALPKGRFLMDVNRTERLTNLSISDSRTEDTAVYYCAVQPTMTQSMHVQADLTMVGEVWLDGISWTILGSIRLGVVCGSIEGW